jgi:uncharacterized protein YcbX
MTASIFDHRGDVDCGIYVHITEGGSVRAGDPVKIL